MISKTRTTTSITDTRLWRRTAYWSLLVISAGLMSHLATSNASAQSGAPQASPSTPPANATPQAPSANTPARPDSRWQTPGQRGTTPNDGAGTGTPNFGGCPYRERELEMLV
ncbi:MAG: hypothetical protein AAFV45_01880 [Pseudomonadota bacterium]